jgi:hypothetical protein
MTTRTRLAQDVHRMTSDMEDASTRIDATLRNLEDHAPGFPSTTPGSGSVGGGGSSTSSRTETLAITGLGTDDAMRDYARIKALVKQVAPLTAEMKIITDRWGYRTAGEWNPFATSPQGKPTEHESNAGRWCTSCARIHVMEPVGVKGRAGLCRWCYDFQTLHTGKLPTHALLDARHRGVKVTETLIRSEMAAPTTLHTGKRKAKR